MYFLWSLLIKVTCCEINHGPNYTSENVEDKNSENNAENKSIRKKIVKKKKIKKKISKDTPKKVNSTEENYF